MGQLETLRNGKRKAVLEALRQGNTRRAAAALAGVDSSTLYQWMADDPALSDAVRQAESESERYLLGKVVDAAPQDWRAAAWILERRIPEYANKETVTLLQRLARDVNGMTNEQLAEIVVASGSLAARDDPAAAGGGGDPETPAGGGW